MPVNLIHSLLHRVDAGWDPIPREYAEQYAQRVWNSKSEALVDKLATLTKGLKDKRVLDLGGGPGQYSVLFAQRGAQVVWHDVSREYQRIARTRAMASGVSLEFSLGYLEAARKFGPDSFDVVFSRVCWYYCRSDRSFARLLYSLVKPGGIGYIECNTSTHYKPLGFRKLQDWLNTYFWWKIGHPMPPHGRIARLIQKYPVTYLELDYSSELFDIILFTK
jgi:2-polyprenyl-3-methyl-5-hydroxy-6-metoxy-1,4-benzoquinol methylase